MNYIMHSKPNDCSVCAVTNALMTLGISVNREDVEKATCYSEKGGFPDTGLKIISEQMALKGEYYPKHNDIIWDKDPLKEGVSTASRFNLDKFFPEYKKKIRKWLGCSDNPKMGRYRKFSRYSFNWSRE